MAAFYETSIWAYLFVTVLAGGGAAFMIGWAGAKRWRPFWQSILYALLLGAAIRFLHWGLFAGAALESWRAAQGTLFSGRYYAADAITLLIFAALGFRLHRVSQMQRQYPWLVKKIGPFTWRMRMGATVQPHSDATASMSSPHKS